MNSSPSTPHLLLLAGLISIASLGACKKSEDNMLDKLPRDSLPMSDPPPVEQPLDRTTPPEVTVTPIPTVPTTAPEQTPPEPVGSNATDPTSAERASAARNELSVGLGDTATDLARLAPLIDCAELRLSVSLTRLHSQWTESCVTV